MAIKYRTKSETLRAVKIDPNLEYVSPELRDDEDVVKAAIINGATIYPVSFRLQNSPEIVSLYSHHTLVPDNDYARVLYSIKLDPTLFYHVPDSFAFRDFNYCEEFRENRQFNIDAKLIRPDFVSLFTEYNNMSEEQLKAEAKKLKLAEIAQIRKSYSHMLPSNTFTFDGAKDFPLIWKLISHRAAGNAFSGIRDIVESQIRLHETEKQTFLSTTRGGSFPEKFMSSLLNLLNIDFSREMVFKWSDASFHNKGQKRYDFYIPSLEAIIEVHGAQHFQRGFEFCGGRTLEAEQANDQYKEQLAKKNGIRYYVVIDASYSAPAYLIKSISNNDDFTRLFNLKNVDWDNVCKGVVKDNNEYPTPIHDIRIRYLTEWLDAINESLTEEDDVPPPNFKDVTGQKPYTEDLENEIKKATPSASGLYPHEILLLSDAVKFYSMTQKDFPGKWFYQYGIADVPYYLRKLEDQGYITSGDIRKTLSMQTLPNLKAFMVKNHLNTNGKKDELIDRILQSISNEVLEQEFATKYYALTAKGQQELEDNQYLFENPNTDQSIWALNRRHAKKLKNGASKPARKHSRKLSPKNYSRKKWTSAAWQAKKDKDYLLEIKLLLNVLYHDLAQVDEQKDNNTLKFIEKNLQYYFPYAHSIIKPAPGLVEEIQLAVKRIGVDNIGLSEIVRSVVAEQEVDPLFFKKGEVIAIINAELINDITTASHVFDTVYQRIKNMD